MKPGLMQQTLTAMLYFRKAGRFTVRNIQFFFLTALLGTNACSRVEDQQLDLVKTPPDAVIQLVKNRVPDATIIKVSPVVPGKVWLGVTYSASKVHHLAVSRKALLLHVSSSALPQDIGNLIQGLDFPYGVFGETRQVQDPVNPEYREFQTVYVVKGERFLVTSKPDPVKVGYIDINMHPRAYSQFVSTDFDDLPSGIQQLPVSRSEFQSVTLTEEGNGVVFQLQFRDGILEVNDHLEVLYSDLGGDTTDVARADLPVQISEWIGSNPPPAALGDFSCRLFRFGGEKGYRVVFQNETQKLHLFFDISGKLRYQYFTASIPA